MLIVVFLRVVCCSSLRAVGVRCLLLFVVACGAACGLRLWWLLYDAFRVLFNVCCCALFAVCCLLLRFASCCLSVIVEGLMLFVVVVVGVCCLMCAACYLLS